MNNTLVILALALVAYLLTCIHQWRRLSRIDRELERTGQDRPPRPMHAPAKHDVAVPPSHGQTASNPGPPVIS
jgi:hypothetical protein